MVGVKLTQEQIDDIVDLYVNGVKTKEIADKYNINVCTVTKNLHKRGVEIKRVAYNKGITKISKDEYSTLVELYNSGMYIKEIAELYNVSEATISNIFKSLNINVARFIRKSQFSDEEIQRMCDLYDSGMSMDKLGVMYNVDKTEIAFLFNKRGKERRDASHARQIYKLNENFFDNIDTQEKAYALGILFADGCNKTENNQITITLQEQDIDILEKLKNAIEYTGPIIYKKARNDKCQACYSLSIGNKHMSGVLNNIGMVPRKSLILEFPMCLDESLYPHFLRGYFDGDGFVDKHEHRYVSSIVSTLSFCEHVQQILFSHGIKTKIYNTYNKESSTRELRITNRENTKKFLDYIYTDATIYMNRKYNIYKSKYCNDDTNNSLSA